MSSVLARTLFETVRVRDGVAPLWPLHLERLRRSAQALDIPLPDITRPEGGEDRVLRFECHDGGLYVTEREVGGTAPLALVTAPMPHQGYPHKVAARAWLDSARLLARARSADDMLFFDADGWLVEASIWAIGWWDRDTLSSRRGRSGGSPAWPAPGLGKSSAGGWPRGGCGARRSAGRPSWRATRRAGWWRWPPWTPTPCGPISGPWRSPSASGIGRTLDPEGSGGHFLRPRSWCL